MATKRQSREDDSAEAVKVGLDDAKQRLANVEATLNSPDQLGQLIADSAAKSTPLRKELSKVILEIFDDHDTRSEVEKVLAKIDRKSFWRWGKYFAGVLVWLATIAGAVFGFAALRHP